MFFRAVLTVVLLVLALINFKYALMDQMVISGPGKKIFYNHQYNALILNNWARTEHLIKGSLKEAENLYIRALRNDPLYIPSWLGLAELYFDTNKKDKAAHILGYVNEIASHTNFWRWERILLSYNMNNFEHMAEDLAYVIKNNPNLRKEAMEMAATIWQTPDDLIKNLGSTHTLDVFNYFVGKRDYINSKAAFHALEKKASLNQDQSLKFIDFSLDSNDLREAIRVWKSYFSHNGLLYNEDFRKEPLNRGFAWHLWEREGFSASFVKDEQDTILHLSFHGNRNISFNHFYQVVPLEPGKDYVFTGKAQTYDLTTNERPYFEIFGYGCGGLKANTPMFPQSQGWRKFEVFFHLPLNCKAVKLGIKRNESHHFDNKISGEMWVKDLKLTEITE